MVAEANAMDRMGRLAAAFTAWMAVPGGATAGSILLTDPDGGFRISGLLESFDGEFYRIQSLHGRLTIAGQGLVCSGPGCPETGAADLVIDARSDYARDLLLTLVEAFEEERGRNIDASRSSGSAGESPETPSIGLRFSEEPEAWRVSRDPGTPLPEGWIETVLAYDALVPAVSVDHASLAISLADLRARLAADSDAAPIFWANEADGPLSDRFDLTPGPGVRRASAQWVARSVSGDPKALALLPLSRLGDALPLFLTGPCGRGSIATAGSILSGDYPLLQRLVLRRPPGQLNPHLEAILAWLDGDVAARVLRAQGLVAPRVALLGPGEDGRFKEAEIEVSARSGDPRSKTRASRPDDAIRLSVTVRFRGDTTLVLPDSRHQLARLARDIGRGRFSGAQLVIAGFSVPDGSADLGVSASRRLAEVVRDALALALGGAFPPDITIKVLAFGDRGPMACNSVDWGKALNRRVEIWLTDDQR